MAADALREDHPNFQWTCMGWSDIDKYACQMHNIVFPQYADRALGDITKIDWHKVKDTYNRQFGGGIIYTILAGVSSRNHYYVSVEL